MSHQSQRKLADYRRKRDFDRTSEPSGRRARARRRPRFVIQEHDATRLHYDFRLEADGVLKSWAVPKGPSTDPAEKRLAVPTEDHPLDYADFEGRIPDEQYGAGPVIVWDRGTYRNLTTGRGREDGQSVPLADAIERGHVKVWLDGEKLTGGYALTRVNRSVEGGRQAWLLVKIRDEAADAAHDPTESRPESVISDRTIDQIEADEE